MSMSKKLYIILIAKLMMSTAFASESPSELPDEVLRRMLPTSVVAQPEILVTSSPSGGPAPTSIKANFDETPSTAAATAAVSKSSSSDSHSLPHNPEAARLSSMGIVDGCTVLTEMGSATVRIKSTSDQLHWTVVLNRENLVPFNAFDFSNFYTLLKDTALSCLPPALISVVTSYLHPYWSNNRPRNFFSTHLKGYKVPSDPPSSLQKYNQLSVEVINPPIVMMGHSYTLSSATLSSFQQLIMTRNSDNSTKIHYAAIGNHASLFDWGKPGFLGLSSSNGIYTLKAPQVSEDFRRMPMEHIPLEHDGELFSPASRALIFTAERRAYLVVVGEQDEHRTNTQLFIVDLEGKRVLSSIPIIEGLHRGNPLYADRHSRQLIYLKNSPGILVIKRLPDCTDFIESFYSLMFV